MRATVFLPDYLIRMHTYSRRCRIQLYGFSRDTLYTYGITFVCMCMCMCMHMHVYMCMHMTCACCMCMYLCGLSFPRRLMYRAFFAL